MLVAAAHQPLFVPWIGYFDKINKVDLFVIVDNVQFTTSGWIRKNTIRTANGVLQLIVPIVNKKHIGQLINEVKIDNTGNSRWKRKHLNTFSLNYGKAPYFKEIFENLKLIYDTQFELLNEFNIELIQFICSYLDINTKIIRSSQINAFGQKTGLIIDICKKTGAAAFMLGMGGSREYADRNFIESNFIKIVEQNFKHPVYKQFNGEFISNLSILDLLFNLGQSSKEFFKTLNNINNKTKLI
jgi:hypothetical protein